MKYAKVCELLVNVGSQTGSPRDLPPGDHGRISLKDPHIGFHAVWIINQDHSKKNGLDLQRDLTVLNCFFLFTFTNQHTNSSHENGYKCLLVQSKHLRQNVMCGLDLHHTKLGMNRQARQGVSIIIIFYFLFLLVLTCYIRI